MGKNGKLVLKKCKKNDCLNILHLFKKRFTDIKRRLIQMRKTYLLQIQKNYCFNFVRDRLCSE